MLSCLYWLFRHLLGLAVLRCRSEAANEVELLVLRHELAVLRRQVVRPSCRPPDRVFLAALARALPRDRWGSVLVRPETIRRWRSGRLPPRAIVISFDNGYRSQYTQALRILARLSWVADENLQLYGLPRRAGRLTPREVRGLVAAG